MNLFEKLSNVIKGKDDTVAAEAEAKAERIKFHRERVRNGPTKFRTVTNGQVRRARDRAIAAEMRRTHRKQVRAYFDTQKEASVLRGHLQALGALSYSDTLRPIDPVKADRSARWVIQRFAKANDEGQIEVTRQVVLDAITAAFNRWQVLTGQEVSPLSPSYELPVRVAA